MTLVLSRDLLKDPYRAIGDVIDKYPLLVGAVVAVADGTTVIIDVRFDPSLEVACHGYRTEQARVLYRNDWVCPVAVPLGPPRTWHHRNGDGTLCMWYPRDGVHRRWEWTQGFARFIAVVHRHLLYEEHFRRGNPWPVADVPHGERADGQPHPIIGSAA